MAITIRGPDGAQIEFPDGTPEAEITSAMNQAYPQPAQQDPGFLSNAVRALATGANPFQDRIVAAEKTLLPQALGGSPGFDYSANLAAEREANEQLRAQHPALANLGQGTGAALSSLAVPAAALGRYAQGTGALGRTALGSAAGAGVGAVQGLGAAPDLTDAGQTFESSVGGATGGAALGAAFPAAGALVGKVFNPLARVPAADIDSLGKAVSSAYAEAKNLGAAYTPEAFGGLVEKIKSDAAADDIDAVLHPKALAAISRLSREVDKAEPVTLKRLDNMRKAIGRDVSGSSDDGERYFGNQLKSNIDSFIANAGPEQMVSGVGPEAATAIQRARDLAQRQFKASDLAEALQRAELRAGSTYSGDNFENATRQNLRRVFEKGNFTPEEAQQYTNAIMGGTGQNILRRVGNALNPSGWVLNREAGAAIAARLLGHGELASIPLAAALFGYGAKKASTAITRGNVDKLMATILAGGDIPQPMITGINPRVALAATLAANQNLNTQRNRSLSSE